ncbi:putative Ig domain-containing protein [Microbacterium hominis]|uniref:RCC1 domain-containing protein n=1 Tax=Microbacterium TaxID=33882 RepID=UPI00168AFC51|nr:MULTISPECIES: putative Ig domain-containing protein [Microbacterium]QOC26749.1 putative Ig domain-containing protein [Microbacterium hominis]QOC27926.1 putative Ig domain-containing protein [Microbacterium hominis]QYF96923.1 putative Ig domain-containing protein [Microbacterium sp. PAMC21962]
MTATLATAAAALTAVLVAAPAVALPDPDFGPVVGGTSVSIDGSDYGFVDAAVGFYVGFAITADGRIFSNGMSTGNGMLGTGSTAWTQETVPVEVVRPAGISFTSVTSGQSSAFATGDDGVLYSWGANDYGELGDGTNTSHATPSPVSQGAVPAGVPLTKVAARYDGGLSFGDSVIALGDGRAYTWGDNSSGQLGDGSTINRNAPVAVAQGAVPSGVRFTDVASAGSSMYALGDDGKVYAWGANDYGQLGDGTTVSKTSPVAVAAGGVPSGVRLTSVVAGLRWAAALGDDGHVYAWGNGASGQLGNGTTVTSSVPVVVSDGAIPAGASVVTLTAGRNSGFAVTSDGTVYSWGDNTYGELGDGTTTSRSTPVAVGQGVIPTGVSLVAIAAGNWSTRGVGSDGKVYVWGENWGGQYGNGSMFGSSPSPVLGPNFAVSQVTFDSLPGTGLATTPSGLTVTTPAHPEGPVDVAVIVSIYGGSVAGPVAIDPVVYVDGFTYIAPPVITTQSLPNGVVGTAYSATVTATSSVPVTYSVASGSLPPGLTLDPATGVVAGTPTTDGVFTFAVTATNAIGSDTHSYTVRIVPAAVPPTITTPSVPSGTVGTGYQTVVEATGDATITFAVAGGSLPPGLTLDPATGEITGTPTQGGTFTFTISATNAAGQDTREYTVTVAVPSAVVPSAVVLSTGSPSSHLAVTGGNGPSWLLVSVGTAMLVAGGVLFAARRHVIRRR